MKGQELPLIDLASGRGVLCPGEVLCHGIEPFEEKSLKSVSQPNSSSPCWEPGPHEPSVPQVCISEPTTVLEGR